MINEYHFDRLVLGGSLESLLYCYMNNRRILLTNNLYPFQLSKIKYTENLKFMGYTSKDIIYKSELWDRLTFVMSMTGHLVMPNIVRTIRLNENTVTTVTSRNKRIIFTADEIEQFDIISDARKVYDWFNVRSGNNHSNDILSDIDNSFVKHIHFYTPTRVGGNKQMKDLVAESSMTEDELHNVDYGEGIVRLKVLRMMKGAGIRGQSNGYNNNGIKLHYAIKVEHTHREVSKIYSSLYSVDDILNTEFERGAQWNLTKKLFRHKQITTLQESFRLPANL